MAVVANLTPTPVPSNGAQGGVPLVLYHVTVTPAGGAGTYTINHGLSYKPTFVSAIPQNAEGTTPALLVSHCVADDSATVIALNFSANGTYDVWYG